MPTYSPLEREVEIASTVYLVFLDLLAEVE